MLTATDPVENFPNYPPVDGVLAQVRALPRAILVDAEKLARQAGSVRATNMVMIGAAAHLLPVKLDTLECYVRKLFAAKGDKVVETNLKALAAGRQAAEGR